jgi:Ca2+-binding EF-hand superfamily protein
MEISVIKNLSMVLSKCSFGISICLLCREDLTERRKNMVLKAFAMMDKSGDGIITASDIKSIFDVTRNPDYLSGRLSKD